MNKKIIIGIIGLILFVLVFWHFSNREIKTLEKNSEGNIKTVTNSESTKFTYPENLFTKYISTVTWPPEMSLRKGVLKCEEAGTMADLDLESEKRIINNKEYCVSEIAEGAAGSTYVDYNYLTSIGDNELASLKFSFRFVQCGNYSEVQKNECETERESFNVDNIVSEIIESIQTITR